ncbi:RraA family protein [Rhodococcus rhodochrous]|uniref:RraA family protein n=1 Tax=Rhodococcus rhodochrous TaxID=1829 RepID=UPI001E4DF76F|nr:RraA family protein [Rhodococcus rhodochrous]MCB8913403.1 RraA family protein [Rhodococcus rhodochrous]
MTAVDDELHSTLEVLRTVSPSTLGHLRDHGLIGSLAPLQRPVSFSGIARTVRVGDTDANGIRDALTQADERHVLVISQPEGAHRACYGGVLGSIAAYRGIAGVVIDGRITDHDQLLELGIPVFHKGISPRVSHRSDRPATIGVPLRIDGESVIDGAVVFADSDGIGVLTTAEAPAVARELLAYEADEAVLRADILAGRRSSW